ncbi:hypothetical protein [Desulfoscipio geothermicus]|uniref:Uncharacterized protein n=1 Tax=Desulfoscipio geothermicus DSM 3669 TaxID=1121426 RepID=A0A1I6ECX5_9FIRM|nr:hypothetical protein [Desulfoscipio geothermicus]SFR15348.1 hypothetical protein SAMN05660706_13530 [Desulfoscipio geothermicus DSM 3669]
MRTVAVLETENAQLKAENRELRAKVEQLEAQCAVMWEALEQIYYGPFIMHKSWTEMIDQALSADAGREMLERVRKLEKVAEAANDCVNMVC